MQSLGRLAEPSKPGQLVPSTNGLYPRRSLLSGLFGTQKAFPHRNRILDGGLFPRPGHKNLFNAHAAEQGLEQHSLKPVTQSLKPVALPKAVPRSPEDLWTLGIHPQPPEGGEKWTELLEWRWRTLTSLNVAFTCNCAYRYISL